MRKKTLKNIPIIIIIISIIINTILLQLGYAEPNNIEETTIDLSVLEAKNIGIGGGGMLHSPAINPNDPNTFTAVPDMGGIYITHDAGLSWERKNLHGTVMFSYFDETRENVLYAGGSGLYRSTDNGDNFELIFPNKDDVIKSLTMNENGLHYIYTKSKIYPTNMMIKDCITNPLNPDNIFVISYYNKKGIVFESKDNGNTFEKLFEYTKSTSGNINYDYNKLFYKKETNELYMINYDGVFKFNRDTSNLDTVYLSNLGIVRVTTIYDTETKFIIIENKDNDDYHTTTKVYYTSDFINNTDLTQSITEGLPYEYTDKYGDSIFDYKFTFIEARNLNDIYLGHASRSKNTSYPYDFSGIIRYKDGTSTYLYGLPFKNHNTLNSRLWIDGNIKPYGLAVSKSDESYVYTTLIGVNYSPDSIELHPRYSTNLGNNKFVTSSIDEQTTYGVRINPFNNDEILLLNTDLGLIKSTDNGLSWSRANNGIKSSWVNTIYDAQYDKYKENTIYSIWSGRHDAPYSAGDESTNYGGFAISTDGGNTWDTNYSSGLPEHAIPVKMSINYENEHPIIYVATFNEGFFVSNDAGKTFISINNGIERVNYNDTKSFILASNILVTEDNRVFGIIARTTYNKTYNNNNSEQPGKVLELIDGTWQEITINENNKNPRNIYYKDKTLYIASTTYSKWDYKNGSDFNNYGGGIYIYKDNKITQIFDESISTTGIQIDSKGTIYISDINGNIYRKEQNKNYIKIYDSYHSISKHIELTDDDTIYLSAFGGGVLKLSNLTKLYKEETNEDKKEEEQEPELSEENEENTQPEEETPTEEQPTIEEPINPPYTNTITSNKDTLSISPYVINIVLLLSLLITYLKLTHKH